MQQLTKEELLTIIEQCACTFTETSLKTVAAEYDVGFDMLRAMCKDQRLKAQKLGKRWYVDRAEVERVFGKAKG